MNQVDQTKSMKPLPLPPRPRILVVALRRLGDVLFATPVIASLRRAFPQAAIDVLVFADTAGILAGNPDIDRVIAMPPRPSVRQGLALALRVAKRYDLAVSTQSGDRPTGFALIAGRRHVGPIDGGTRGALRRRVLSRSVAPQPGEHRLEAMLRLVDAIGVARVGHLVAPAAISSAAQPGAGQRPYAVIHAAPMFVYKRWTADGWRALAAALRERGLEIRATGGPDASERAYLDEVWGGAPDIVRLDGQLSWPELAALLRGANVFVGPDTSVTHLAAASGCPTVALYGPTDPRIWGPVPAEGLDPESAPMWAASGTIQRRKNVWLVQNPLPCQPCQNEGCERHVLSFSKCLDELTPVQVLRAVDAALAASPMGVGSAAQAAEAAGGRR
jgi:heptosyltransferase-3